MSPVCFEIDTRDSVRHFKSAPSSVSISFSQA